MLAWARSGSAAWSGLAAAAPWPVVPYALDRPAGLVALAFSLTSCSPPGGSKKLSRASKPHAIPPYPTWRFRNASVLLSYSATFS